MIVERRDLPLLKWSALALLLAAGAGVAAILYGQHALDRQEQSLRATEHRLTQQRRASQEAEAARQEAARHQPAYESLLQRGIFQYEENGSENEWRYRLIARMENLRERHPFSQFSYAILPQTTGAAPPAPAAFSFYQHGMTLRFTLPHEGHVLEFLNALRHEGRDVFLLERCAIARGETGLDTECAGSWITLTGRAEK